VQSIRCKERGLRTLTTAAGGTQVFIHLQEVSHRQTGLPRVNIPFTGGKPASLPGDQR
jgi:hypothetical protein